MSEADSFQNQATLKDHDAEVEETVVQAISDDNIPKLESLLGAIQMENVPEIVTEVINYAIDQRSSDIHIEPNTDEVHIRYRVDGVLQVITSYPISLHPAIVSRVKIISNLKIDEQRIPQDGRAKFITQNPITKETFEADLRVSTFPTVTGEKIVMRIQDKSAKIPALQDLGVRGNNLKSLNKIIKSPHGVVLLSGPTGSGKTTTMYAILQEINKPEINILTLEDPVEYQMSGLNQSQVRPDIGYSFAEGLRTALRQDPDVIMIGEMRDMETMEIAIRAALTGHLVLSTIHTNSAVETITRIRDMGIADYLTTSAVKGIIAQRLVRQICPHCKESVQPSDEVFEDIKQEIETMPKNQFIDPKLLEDVVIYRGKGCDICNNTGYVGRTGIYEVLLIDDDIKDLVQKSQSIDDMQKAARIHGMLTLKQDGILKVLEGITSIEEIYRVTSND
ncbi:MAG: GspE/PulE family protein [Candidatus Gracilibacteria bacterium]|nr:GspE/PulE family protein [Candidatus Gracilibacteria bacterium]